MIKDGKSINTIYFGGEKFVSLKNGKYVINPIGHQGIYSDTTNPTHLYSDTSLSSTSFVLSGAPADYYYTIEGFYYNLVYVSMTNVEDSGDSGSGWTNRIGLPKG